MFTFRKVIPYLTPKYRVVAVDLRGFGDSERPATGYDCGTMASDPHQSRRPLRIR